MDGSTAKNETLDYKQCSGASTAPEYICVKEATVIQYAHMTCSNHKKLLYLLLGVKGFYGVKPRCHINENRETGCEVEGTAERRWRRGRRGERDEGK